MHTTLVELFEQRINLSATAVALRHHTEGGWQTRAWREWWQHSERLAAGLLAVGLETGDRVAIVAHNRAEWVEADLGTAMAGGVVVPLYPTHPAATLAHILADSGARVAFVEDPRQLQRLVGARATRGMEVVVCLETLAVLDHSTPQGRQHLALEEVEVPAHLRVLSLAELSAIGQRLLGSEPTRLVERRGALTPQSPFTIVYTSGTTGTPRGVVLTHANIVAQIEALRRLEVFRAEDVSLLCLPLAHIFARLVYLASLGHGFETAFARAPADLVEDLRELEPTILAGVPRIYERLREHVEQELSRTPTRRALRRLHAGIGGGARALELGRQHALQRAATEGLRGVQRQIMRAAAQGLEELWGRRMRLLVSGGAALDPALGRYFHGWGHPIHEGYGLTETTAAASFNVPDAWRPGSVGRPVPGVDIMVAEDNEILVRGPTVMAGYHEKPELTAITLDAEGWLATGDLGHFDAEGYLHVTGRKKELLVTNAGYKVAPAPLEARLEASPLVRRALVCGEGRGWVAALVHAPLAQEGDAEREDAPLAASSRLSLRQALVRLIREINRELAPHERIRAVAFVEEDFGQDARFLTPTGKWRRREVYAALGDHIEALYALPPSL